MVLLEHCESFESLRSAIGHAVALVLGYGWGLKGCEARLDAFGSGAKLELRVLGS